MISTFILYANKTQLSARKREPVTSGSVNIYKAHFEFSVEWDWLKKTVVFRAGEKAVSVLLDETRETVIPWEVLTTPGRQLEVGVYGTNGGGEVVLPTVWANLGVILPGVIPGEGAGPPPTPELWEQELERKGDGLDLDGLTLRLMSGDKPLSEVELPSPGGGGEGGTSDHRLLSHRDAERQHPIQSIEGLQEELRRIPSPVEPLTNEELEEILK